VKSEREHHFFLGAGTRPLFIGLSAGNRRKWSAFHLTGKRDFETPKLKLRGGSVFYPGPAAFRAERGREKGRVIGKPK